MGLLFLGGNVDHWLELGLAFLSSNSLAVLAAALMILGWRCGSVRVLVLASDPAPLVRFGKTR